MADRHLQHAGHGPQEVGQVVAVQVVAGVDLQPHRQRGLGRGGVARQHLGTLRCVVGAGKGLGVELDPVGAAGAGGGHHVGQRVHEQADPHAQRLGLGDQRLQAAQVVGKAPAVVAGELVFAVGHEGHLVRPNLAHEVHQVLERVALDVVLGFGPLFHQRRQRVHVRGADMPRVGPRVHGDALRARFKRLARQLHHVGDAQMPGVAQQRDLVDVDRQRGAVRPGVGFGGDERVHGGPVGALG